MAKKIQAYTEFGPRLEPATPLSGDELIEQITEGSNESMSSVLAVLSALDSATEQALKAGRIVGDGAAQDFRDLRVLWSLF